MTRWTKSALAAALTMAVAPFAFAGGGKPAKPPAKSPTPAPAATTGEKAGSLEEIEASADAAEKASRLDLRKHRYERVAAYVAANPKAKDAEQALGVAMDLAEEIENWAKTTEHADAYVKEYPEGTRKTDALLTKAHAVANSGAKDDAKKAFEAAFAAINADTADVRAVVGATVTIANALVERDDVDGAKTVYQALKDTYASHAASDQIAKFAEDALQNLEPIGKPPTAIEDAKDFDGKAISLADYKDKVLLIDFWATWCPPCRAEIPIVLKAYERFHDKGFEVLGVSLDDEADELKKYIADKKMPWRQIRDGRGGPVQKSYGVEGIPYTVLVGRDGKVMRIGLRGEALTKMLEKVFATK